MISIFSGMMILSVRGRSVEMNMKQPETEMFGNYGVPRDLRARIKIIGLYMVDILFVAGTILFSAMFASKIFVPKQLIQMIMFILLSGFIMLYLRLPINGGKRTWRSFYLYIRRRKKFFRSFEWRAKQ